MAWDEGPRRKLLDRRCEFCLRRREDPKIGVCSDCLEQFEIGRRQREIGHCCDVEDLFRFIETGEPMLTVAEKNVGAYI